MEKLFGSFHLRLYNSLRKSNICDKTLLGMKCIICFYLKLDLNFFGCYKYFAIFARCLLQIADAH